MYLQIKKAELQDAKFGKDLKISMIGLYDDSGKWIKWVKLNNELIAELLKAKISINGE